MTPSSGLTMVLDGQRPSYSINGILGIPQQDANANINKRKRDDEEDDRDLNGHHEHDDLKRHRNLVNCHCNERYPQPSHLWLYCVQAYNNSVDSYSHMWATVGDTKWGVVKEEPKGSAPGTVMPNPTGTPQAPSSGGSPHPQVIYPKQKNQPNQIWNFFLPF